MHTNIGCSWTSILDHEQPRIDWSVPCTEEEIPSLPRWKEFMLKELKVAAGGFRRRLFIGNDYQDHIFRRLIRMPTAVPNSFMSIDVKELRPTDLPDLEPWIEVLTYLCSLHHPHIEEPIGFCSEDGTWLLVYESSPNGTLADNLFQHKGRELLSGRSEPLSWATRIKVAIGVAKGLSFLHDAKNQVIHGNVRASNIVLDSEFHAKLSDFSLAIAQTIGNRSDVSGRIWRCRKSGSYPVGCDEADHCANVSDGYSAPDYLETGNSSQESDVYSFGVVLLELLSGRRVIDAKKPFGERNLVQWAGSYFQDERNLHTIMDPKLNCEYPKEGAHTMMKLGLSCAQHTAKHRPSMQLVLRELEQIQT